MPVAKGLLVAGFLQVVMMYLVLQVWKNSYNLPFTYNA